MPAGLVFTNRGRKLVNTNLTGVRVYPNKHRTCMQPEQNPCSGATRTNTVYRVHASVPEQTPFFRLYYIITDQPAFINPETGEPRSYAQNIGGFIGTRCAVARIILPKEEPEKTRLISCMQRNKPAYIASQYYIRLFPC